MDNLSAGLAQAASAIASFLSLRIPQATSCSSASSSGGVCVSETLTAVSKVQLGAVVPFAVAGAMVIILAASRLWSRCRASKQLQPVDTAGNDPLQTALLIDGDATIDVVNTSVSIQAHHSEASSMSYRSRLIAAGVNFGLTVYSAFVTVVVQMLHCVAVPGAASSHLFIQGFVTCDLSG